MYAIYDWITSILRPRGRFKALEAPPDTADSACEAQQSPETQTTEQQQLPAHQQDSLVNVEFIPTLNFIAFERQLDWQHVTTQTENTADDDDEADRYSTHTYIITTNDRATSTTNPAVATQTSPERSLESGNASRLSLSASIADEATEYRSKTTPSNTPYSAEDPEADELHSFLFSLGDLAGASLTTTSFVDEPTSSISIEMAEAFNAIPVTTSKAGTETTTTTGTTAESSSMLGATTTGTSSGRTTTMTTTTGASESAFTAITTPSSAEQSIEEEIEEALEVSAASHDEPQNTESHTDSLGNQGAAALRPPKIQAVSSKVHDLFGIDDCSEDEDGEEGDEGDVSLELSDGKLRLDTSSSADFKIDDKQLSGSEIAQHFMNDDEDEEADEQEEAPELSLSAAHDNEQSEHTPEASESHKSLSNQSTADDVSDDLLEEPPPQSSESKVEEVRETNQISSHAESPLLKNEQQSEAAVEPAVPRESPQQLRGAASPERTEKDDVAETKPSSSPAQSPLQENEAQSEPIAATGAALDSPEQLRGASPEHTEKDHSIEEVVETNASIELAFDEENLSSLNTSFDINNETLVDRLLADTTLQWTPDKIETGNSEQITDLDEEMEKAHSDEEDDTSLKLLKVRILAMQANQARELQESTSPTPPPIATAIVQQAMEVKQMERVPLNDFTKDVLEDITEESERNSLSTAEEQQSLSLEQSKAATLQGSALSPTPPPIPPPPPASDMTPTNSNEPEPENSLTILKLMEQKINELQLIVSSKDACLASLQLQLDSLQKRESNSAGSINNEQPCSGRDTSSLVTNSTEYRTFQEDFGTQTNDMLQELTERDELIAKLTESLKQSMLVREKMQSDSDKLNADMQLLRKQLHDAMDNVRRSQASGLWSTTLRANDLESNAGQRISEISMDLISETDDDDELDRQFLTDNEEKYSRNSRERQLSQPPPTIAIEADADTQFDWSPPFSKQIEQFQKYLTPAEIRLFHMVQKKFDDYLCKELEKNRQLGVEAWQAELQQKDEKIKRLVALSEEKARLHKEEMEELRKYFEHKCADLEKQFSDDVFSQKSQHHGDTSAESDNSEQELQLHDEIAPLPTLPREISPRKRARNALLNSPSHRQMTPMDKDKDDSISTEIADMKSFYQQKMQELKQSHSEAIRRLNEKIKYYEQRYPDDEFMTEPKANTNTSTATNPASTTAMPNAAQPSPSPLPPPRSNAQLLAQEAAAISQELNTSLIIIDQDELNFNNESQVIQKIIAEYERRLQEQLALAREDIVHELEQQIQNLLSETTADDQHWPKELILLREKFTAKSQLEIAQLQIKHAEEMSRLRSDYEKQLNRKFKRNITFDSAREYNQIVCERDGLRELSKGFRVVLAELAKCVATCEDELNTTIAEEVQRHLLSVNNAELLLDQSANYANQSQDGNQSAFQLNATLSNTSLRTAQSRVCVPDVQNLLELVEDPSLMQFISKQNSQNSDDFDIHECLDRLNKEAAYLLTLSEQLGKQRRKHGSESSGAEKSDSCCEEADDEMGKLDCETQELGKAHRQMRAQSLNEQQLFGYDGIVHTVGSGNLNSLPVNLQQQKMNSSSVSSHNASELNLQLVELKNRLIKSESDRQKLQAELVNTISRNAQLGQELQNLRDQLSQVNSLNQTEYTEGYGLGGSGLSGISGLLKTSLSEESQSDKTHSSFTQLQERARHLLATPKSEEQLKATPEKSRVASDSTLVLLQMIEDFCREGDRVVETNRKDRDDLQAQIDTADKQLKATRQFLEEQAIEREQERDEFLREIERLKSQLRDVDKERTNYANASEEFERLESQIRDLKSELKESQAKRDKFEIELKASIDKIFVLREIITELETQVETKALNEHVQGEKIKQLEEFINSQNRSNETLQNEVQSLKLEIDEDYQARIRMLEDKLQNIRPTAEQSMIMDQVVEQLRDIENTLEQKTRTLEAMHNISASNSCSLSATEDVSVHGTKPAVTAKIAAIVSPPQGSPVHPSPRQHSVTMEAAQRILEKLAKHSRVEEAAIKRIADLDMHVQQIRNAYMELQQERNCLQERMCEQTQRISALQSRLDEQRQRAEDLQRANTTDLNIRIHDLQNQVQTLSETLSNRDKQLATMKQQLEKSKIAIDRLEAELLVEQNPDRSQVERLENELKLKNNAIQNLKDKIKNEMINKLALPDLMETMLADKNDEIDHLREQLEAKERQLEALKAEYAGNSSQASQASNNSNLNHNNNSKLLPNNNNNNEAKEDCNGKLSARTLSDIVSISDYDEPDVVRRAALQHTLTPLHLPEGGAGSGFLYNNTLECSKEVHANLTQKRSDDLSGAISAIHPPIRSFEHPHYFQDPNAQAARLSSTTLTPGLVPRHINFSDLTDDSKVNKSANFGTLQTPQRKLELQQLQQQLAALEKEKDSLMNEKNAELKRVQLELSDTVARLQQVQAELLLCRQEMQQLKLADVEQMQQIADKSQQIEELLSQQTIHTEKLSKQEKELHNYLENERQYQQRIDSLEKQMLEETARSVEQRDSLRKELYAVSEAHAQCKFALQDLAARKKEIEQLNHEIKAKDERVLVLMTKLSLSEENIAELRRALDAKEQELAELAKKQQQQQQNSEGSSRQFSVDEIAQQVEKELNYSAQLDSNILKAIESEEENNFDREKQQQQLQQEQQASETPQLKSDSPHKSLLPILLPKTESTDDENFTGERDLLNQLEALRVQINIEREQNETIRRELLLEKQHSQEIQEQDVIIIEAMRKRLENSLEKEDELHKQLDIERERCERFQTQLTALQRSESRRNSSLLLKSPNDSPRKSPRQHSDNDSELAERLRSEIKMLAAQNERERERSTDLQRSTERERQRYDIELQERIDYCERLKKEMEKLARDKDAAELEIEHLQERLTLQTSEIESLEARLVTLQEAETRRTTRRDRQQKETTQLLIELQEIKARLIDGDSERAELNKTIIQLRYDIERAAVREAQLADALTNANAKLANAADATATVPQQFLQKMKEINLLLAENTQENRQMAETVQFLVDERRQLQKKCEELEQQVCSSGNVVELEERCNYLFGRYLRVESHRKALVYQKRYLKLSLQRYQDNEQRLYEHMHAANPGMQLVLQEQARKKKLFKTVALAIIAIQRIKFIGRVWHTGKRIVSKSVFTITQQKRTVPSTAAAALCCPPTLNGIKQNFMETQTTSPQHSNDGTPASPFRALNEQRMA